MTPAPYLTQITVVGVDDRWRPVDVAAIHNSLPSVEIALRLGASEQDGSPGYPGPSFRSAIQAALTRPPMIQVEPAAVQRIESGESNLIPIVRSARRLQWLCPTPPTDTPFHRGPLAGCSYRDRIVVVDAERSAALVPRGDRARYQLLIDRSDTDVSHWPTPLDRHSWGYRVRTLDDDLVQEVTTLAGSANGSRIWLELPPLTQERPMEALARLWSLVPRLTSITATPVRRPTGDGRRPLDAPAYA